MSISAVLMVIAIKASKLSEKLGLILDKRLPDREILR